MLAAVPLSALPRRTVAVLSTLALLAGALVAGVSPAAAVPGAGSNVWINEIHYDNAGTDTGEAIEVAAPSGTDLSGWSLVRYNGSANPATATTYASPAQLTSLGTATGPGGGWGFAVATFAVDGLQNGGNDGVALVNPSGTVVQLLSYEGVLTASNGPASGLTSTDIGRTESGTTPTTHSLQLTGTGDDPADFTWAAEGTSTFGSVNTGQSIVTAAETAPSVATSSPAPNAFNVPVDSNVTVTFDEPVSVAAGAFDLSCAASGPHTVTVSGGPTTYSLDPAGTFAGYDNCTVTVDGDKVTDADANDPPDTMAADHRFTFTTVAPTGTCEGTYTHAWTIQGDGATSPLVGKRVATQGVVVGDYEGATPGLRGYYVQDLVPDGDQATSDALFVFNGANTDLVDVGDVVWVTGTASENQGQTQISQLTMAVCSGIAVPADFGPADVSLPVPSSTYLERFEGMLVEFDQTLAVTETFLLGRFGQITMSSGERLWQPTQIAEPGGPALALQATNDLDRIIVDDNLQSQNPDPIAFGRGGEPLTSSNTLRMGDTADDVAGVMTFTWAGNSASGNAYRVRPLGSLGGEVPTFEPSNPRPEQPEDVGGSLKVASFNVLNYFNTFGADGCTLGVGGAVDDCRGADNSVELERQAAKIVDALVKLDADVVGLIEIENDGYGPGSAMQDLVNRVNSELSAVDAYQVLDVDYLTGQTNAAGTDAIKVGFIYRPSTVSAIGETAVLNTGTFGLYEVEGDEPGEVEIIGRNRPAVTQTFLEKGTGGRVTVSVNHLKSKGSGCEDNISPVGPDPDALDGQGNCNLTRAAAAAELADWLAGYPTKIKESDQLIIGDLNAYAMEDPVVALEDADFVNMIAEEIGPKAYSFVFDGQSGYLDHALASPSLVGQISGVTEWHINADEPTVLDYNTNFKNANQIEEFYAPDAFRSSDHDPVLVGLNLAPQGRPRLALTD